MSNDPFLIEALRNAVKNDPENVSLRLHLTQVLLGADLAAEAIEHTTFVLARQPDHLDALKLAFESATAIGDSLKAASYRNLYEAIGLRRAQSMFDASGVAEAADPSPTKSDAETADVEDASEDEGPVRLEAVGTRGGELFDAERPTITLADVAGMELVKRRLNLAFLGPLRHPDISKAYRKSLRGGLLLYGPPGCGKTYIARALAGEIGAKFLAVGYTDVVDMYLGESERRMHELFENARRSRPCVVFIDEMDAFGRKRSLTRDHAGRTLVNQLLAELDNVQADNEGLFLMAASNHPWDIDEALRRPGRIDRAVLVLPPDASARAAIIRFRFEGRPTQGIDVEDLARRTEGFSGADLAHVCESAVEFAIEDSLTTGRTRPVAQSDVLRALKEVKPSTRPWFETAKNYALYANEGGAYDDLLEYLRSKRML